MWLFKSSICILLQLCLLFQNIYCNEENVDNDIILSTDDLQNIRSFFYMSEKHSSDAETQKISAVAQQCNYNICKKWNERNNQEVVFYKRLVTILLSNLAMQKVDGDRFMGIINIEASSSQLEYLQNFVNGQGSIREVDQILSNIITSSGFSTYQSMAEISYYFNILLETLTDYASFISKRWDISIISFIVIINFMFLRRHRFSYGLIIFLIIDVILVISFFMTWWQLIQEQEIKLMTAQSQYREMPITCKPHKMSNLEKIMSYFYPNDCEKYYESIMTDPRLQITPAFVLVHLLSTTIMQPLSHFGIVISEFTDKATSKLDFLSKCFVQILFFTCFGMCIILIPFYVFGGCFNFGFGFFNFGLRGKSNKYDRIERIENVSKKRLKHSRKMKQIMSRQNKDNMDVDSAGGDAISDTHVLSSKCEKCKCRNIDENEDESIKHEKKEEGDGDC